MGVRTATMGRPKKAALRPEEPAPKTIGFRVSWPYGLWLEKLAKHHRTTVSGVMDRALAEWAASQGFEEPAPERMP